VLRKPVEQYSRTSRTPTQEKLADIDSAHPLQGRSAEAGWLTPNSRARAESLKPITTTLYSLLLSHGYHLERSAPPLSRRRRVTVTTKISPCILNRSGFGPQYRCR
jgi:hypothetical protein